MDAPLFDWQETERRRRLAMKRWGWGAKRLSALRNRSDPGVSQWNQGVYAGCLIPRDRLGDLAMEDMWRPDRPFPANRMDAYEGICIAMTGGFND